MKRFLQSGLAAMLLLSTSLSGQARLPRPSATKAIPLPTQDAPLPPDIETDGYAKHAAHLPLYLGPIGAPAWILMDADSGRVLDSHNADQRMFPASTTKTMTTLLAVEQGNLDATVTIGPNPPKTGESSINLLQGEQFVLRDLVKAALIKSANDSCVAIAEAVAGSEAAFVKRMNARAKELGALNTHFMNPHGLHNPQHYTTPQDLALIARQAMALPVFRQIAQTRETEIHGNWKIGPRRLLLNRNRLLFRWRDCIGVKTGYTRQAGNCLVAMATRSDQSGRPWHLLAVVMKSPNSWSDAYNLLTHHGYEIFTRQTLAAKDAVLQEFRVPNAANSVSAITGREISVPLRAGELENLRQQWMPLKLTAPIKRGDFLGRVRWTLNGSTVCESKLFAAHAAAVGPLSQLNPEAAGTPELLPPGSSSGWHFTPQIAGIMLLIVSAGVGALAVWRLLRR